MANTTTSRFSSGANQDTTFRTLNYDKQSETLTSTSLTASITTTAYLTSLNLNTLPIGVNTLDIVATGLTAADTVFPLIGDKLEVIAIGGASGTSSVVFNANYKMQTSNTITVGADKNMSASFIYNGTYWIGSGFSI